MFNKMDGSRCVGGRAPPCPWRSLQDPCDAPWSSVLPWHVARERKLPVHLAPGNDGRFDTPCWRPNADALRLNSNTSQEHLFFAMSDGHNSRSSQKHLQAKYRRHRNANKPSALTVNDRGHRMENLFKSPRTLQRTVQRRAD